MTTSRLISWQVNFLVRAPFSTKLGKLSLTSAFWAIMAPFLPTGRPVQARHSRYRALGMWGPKRVGQQIWKTAGCSHAASSIFLQRWPKFRLDTNCRKWEETKENSLPQIGNQQNLEEIRRVNLCTTRRCLRTTECKKSNLTSSAPMWRSTMRPYTTYWILVVRQSFKFGKIAGVLSWRTALNVMSKI